MADFIFDINTIVAGNNGNKLPLTIRNASSIEGASVRVAIKRGAEVFTKQAVITDAATGKCEITLSAVDLPTSGLYFYQPTITYADGREFTGEVGRFTVGGKLRGQPPVTIPVGIDLNRLGISVNNHLTIDGVEQIGGGTGGGSTEPLPSNVILFEDWVGGESVTIDTSTAPPADTTAPVLTISPNGGNFASTQGVTMTTNETADIYYTLDGSTPTTASTKYTAALSLSATTTLKAFAVDMAGNSSAVQTVTFTKDVSAPADTTAPVVTASPAAGTYTSAQTVTLSANETATIYYTTNGTTPTTASTVYSAPISISATTTLQFMAKDTAGNQSAPVAATYTINILQADTTAPVLTMTASATFADTQTVNMSANETADIWYTVDGSDPVASGTRVKYTTPVTLTATTTLKAYAVDTAGNASAVQTVVYTKQITSGTIIASDDFNRADGAIGTSTTGQAWIAGGASIVSNQAKHGTTNYPYIDTGRADNFSIEADFILPTLVTGNISGLTARINSSNTGSVIWGALNNGTVLGFLNTLSGVSAAPANVNFTFIAGQVYRLKMEVTGNVYRCYIDGTLIHTYTDTNSIGLTNTKHGFIAYNTSVPRFDNFAVKTV